MGRDSKSGQWLKGEKSDKSYKIPKGLRISPETEYKEDNVPWNARDTGIPTWSERDGWITCLNEKITTTTRGKEYKRRRRTSYSRYLWEKLRGEIPKGYVVLVAKQSPDYVPTIDDLSLISRSELMKRNSNK
jgi:hypothetical protein